MADSEGWRRRENLFKQAFALTADVSRDALLRRVLDLAIELGHADHGALVLFDADGEVEHLASSAVADERRRLDRATVDAGVVGRVVSEARIVRLPEVGEDPSLVGFPRAHQSGPFLGLPITLWGVLFGVLCLGRRAGAPEFGAEDEHEMGLLGAQLGVALDHTRLLQEARNRERALVAIKEVSQAILEGLPTDDVLRLVAQSARELAGASTAWVNTPDPTGGLLVLRAASGVEAEALVGMTYREAGSITGRVMRGSEPLLVQDVSADPRVRQPVVVAGGMGPALFVPLTGGDGVFGTLSVANRYGGKCFKQDDIVLLQTFAAEAGVALRHGEIRADLERLSLLEERERIAMDLHDGVIQALFVVGLSLQTAQEAADDPAEVSVRLADAVGSIDQTIRDLRDYIFGLQPSDMDDNRLERALREVASGFQRSTGVAMLVDIDPKASAVLAASAPDITHIAREAMANAVRHSGAGRVTVDLRVTGGEAVMDVADDGSGFDPAQAEGRGNGLVNLRTRAEALGGVLTIDSRFGAGSTVRLRLPV
jgi:signal transduction histidine kinase